MTNRKKRLKTALCCRCFIIENSPKELRRLYDTWKTSLNDPLEVTGLFDDISVLYPMLKYIGLHKQDADGKPTIKSYHHYTCKHLDREKGICTIYDIRPELCRAFPINKEEVCCQKCETRHICNGLKGK